METLSTLIIDNQQLSIYRLLTLMEVIIIAIKVVKNNNPTQSEMQQALYRPKGQINIIPYYKCDEIWIPITSIPNLQDWYYISNYGRVYSKLYNQLIRPRYIGHGYYTVTLRAKDNTSVDALVHRLVLSNFCPVENMNSLQVNHKNCIKTDNRLENLEWTTCLENISHAINNNLYESRIGLNSNFGKIEDCVIHEICKLLQNGISIKEIVQKTNLNELSENPEKFIRAIRNRKIRKNISKDYSW